MDARAGNYLSLGLSLNDLFRVVFELLFKCTHRSHTTQDKKVITKNALAIEHYLHNLLFLNG